MVLANFHTNSFCKLFSLLAKIPTLNDWCTVSFCILKLRVVIDQKMHQRLCDQDAPKIVWPSFFNCFLDSFQFFFKLICYITFVQKKGYLCSQHWDFACLQILFGVSLKSSRPQYYRNKLINFSVWYYHKWENSRAPFNIVLN